MVYNIMTCSGFGDGTALGSAVGVAPGGCMGARLGIVGLFFLIAVIRKWGGEEMNIDFSFLWSLVLGLGTYFILVTIFGSTKIAFIGGLITGIIGGYGTGYFFGDGGGGYD